MEILKDPILQGSFVKTRRNAFEFPGEVIPAYMGRYAIYRILNMLGIKASEEVLIPTYHCLTMVEPIIQYGCGIGLYRTKMCLQTTIEDIRRAVGNRTRAVVLIHYFGIPQKRLDEIRRYLEGEKIFLIEDCAHVISRKGDVVGSVGDVSFYTPRKFLPVPDGAIIRINNPKLMNRIHNRRLTIFGELKTLKNICERRFLAGEGILKEWYARIDGRINRLRKRSARTEGTETASSAVEYDSRFTDVKCSLAAQYLMKTSDFEEIYKKRTSIFAYLFEAVYGRGLSEPLEFLNQENGECTFGFPVLSAERKQKIRILKGRGIETFTFGETLYREEELEEGSDEMKLSKNLFFIPINQDFNSKQVEYLSECLQDVLGSST